MTGARLPQPMRNGVSNPWPRAAKARKPAGSMQDDGVVNPMRQILFAVLALVLAAWASATCAADSPRPIIDLYAGDFYVEPATGTVGLLIDSSSSLDIEAVRARLDDFQTVETNHVDFGQFSATKGRIWAHYRVRNATANDGRWILNSHKYYGPDYFAIYRAEPGSPATLPLRFPAESDSENLYGGPYIATELELRAGEVADIYIGISSADNGALLTRFATPERYRNTIQQRDAINLTANGAWIALILVALLMGRAIGWPLALSFSAYQTCALVMILVAENYLVGPLRDVPGLVPRLNTAFYLLTPFFMLLFCQQFFETHREFPVIDRLLRWWRAAFIVAAPIIVIFIDWLVLGWGHLLLNAPAVALYVVTAAWAKRRRVIGATPILIGSLMIVLTAAIDAAEKSVIGLIHPDTVIEFAHISFVVEAFLFASAIVYRFLKLRQERDRSLRAELAGTQDKLRLSKALAASQRKFDAARRQAEQRRAEMASVSHDLQQPLVSLRQGLARIKRLDRGSAAEMQTAFDYLERLTHSNIEETRPDDTGADGSGGEGGEEVFPISAVLDNVVAMFRHEAEAKGLSLRYHPCAAMVRAEPLALMRIASNLVSNAIKHGTAGGVLIGCRMRGDRIMLEVHDTGPGMTTAQLTEAMEPYRKGEASGGSGLGLHLVEAMCLDQGLTFAARSAAGRGSSFRVGIPRA